ncbi:hypothetical protein VTL71DRAFT_1634 [Oculimacula yallundae]|uniref:BZIP domain-containing protein n=1 Tax=Oculimacula yallundae TaxID=86028 RepID=A0ABR4CBQ7_9HELO
MFINSEAPACDSSFFSSSLLLFIPKTYSYNTTQQPHRHSPRCSKLVTPTTLPTDTISQLQYNTNSTPPQTTIPPHQEELTPQAPSFDLNFTVPTNNILPEFFNSFTTDSNPRWLPPSSSSLPAQSPQLFSQDLSHPESLPQQPNHQDFVLFERSPSVRSSPSLSNNQAAAISAQHRRNSSHLSQSAQSLQNQRVAAIIQSTGHSITTSALTNRFNTAQSPQQFYASSAPSSTTALQQQRQTRPQVPLFSQSTGSIPHTPNMVMQDMDLFDDFTAFEGGASTQNSFPSAYSSPAVPTLYDQHMNLSSSSSTNMGTVSPQDLLRDPFASAPNSTAFTNLTSPDSQYHQSPEFADYDVSPFIGDNQDLDQALTGDPWYPLFPQDDQVEKPNPQVEQSPLLPEEELEVSEHLRRRRSGTATSPPSGGVKKREKALPPIVVEDPNDTVAMKRARNTLAARKSRQRKMQRFEELEDEIAKLKDERDHWKSLALRRTGP